MDEIEIDLYETKKLIDGKNTLDNWSKIYGSTNENLENLFKCFSVKDKDVFSVMASSDQPFCAYYNGAKSVETFDRNKLAKHYHYLRRWLLKYENRLYPTPDEIKKNNEWIYNLLNLVECDSLDEELSYKYWYSYIMSIPGFLGKDLFKRCSRENMAGISDNELLRGIIEKQEVVFKHQDICADIKKSKNYDTIIMSNILEYYNFYRSGLITCRDNLYDILKDKGEVICTNLLDYVPSTLQQEVFLEKFDYEVFDSFSKWESKECYPIGYCYRKK